MPAGTAKMVWILGAGFSRSLGGPLLVDLFRPRSPHDDGVVFPSKYRNLARDLQWTRYLFNHGKQEGLWSDAEEFLSYVDSAYATDQGPRKSILQNLLNRPPSTRRSSDSFFRSALQKYPFEATTHADLRRIVRRALAAQVAEFLLDLDEQDERWLPYRSWVASLDPNSDTIVSLNYDLVLEGLKDPRLHIVLPAEAKRIEAGKTRVLKLHGSVDWQVRDGLIDRAPVEKMLASETAQPVLAAPGRTKAAAVSTTLKPLWDAAYHALAGADIVVMLGYSFPKTDAGAREKILGAIAGGDSSYRTRRIDVVMGPDTSGPDIRRVQSLAEGCRSRRRLIVAPAPPSPPRPGIGR